MNATAATATNVEAASMVASKRPSRRAIFIWIIAVCAMVACIAVPYTVVNSLRLERETVRLRDSVIGTLSEDGQTKWSKLVEVHVGHGTLALARVVTQFADLPEEARQALRAARSASVGVYQWHGADLAAIRSRMASGSASLQVDGREWVRLASVRSGGDSVLVLTPADGQHGTDILDVCVVVMTDGQLVVVNASVDTQPLLELIQPHLRELRREIETSV